MYRLSVFVDTFHPAELNSEPSTPISTYQTEDSSSPLLAQRNATTKPSQRESPRNTYWFSTMLKLTSDTGFFYLNFELSGPLWKKKSNSTLDSMKRVKRGYFLPHLTGNQLIKQICVSLAVSFLNVILQVPEIGRSLSLQNFFLCSPVSSKGIATQKVNISMHKSFYWFKTSLLLFGS